MSGHAPLNATLRRQHRRRCRGQRRGAATRAYLPAERQRELGQANKAAWKARLAAWMTRRGGP